MCARMWPAGTPLQGPLVRSLRASGYGKGLKAHVPQATRHKRPKPLDSAAPLQVCNWQVM